MGQAGEGWKLPLYRWCKRLLAGRSGRAYRWIARVFPWDFWGPWFKPWFLRTFNALELFFVEKCHAEIERRFGPQSAHPWNNTNHQPRKLKGHQDGKKAQGKAPR